MRTRKKRQQRAESHDNADRWLLTYADLITLLLGLFVILYAMSQVDNTKYSKVVQALGGMFGKTTSSNGGTTIVPGVLTGGEREVVENKLRGALYEDIKSNLVTVTQDQRGITVHLAEELLFASGDATIKRSSANSLDLLASVLKALPNELRIEGHTDDVPINTAAFPSNWHLSVARAMNTGDYLMTRHGLQPHKVMIVGFGQYQPIVPNTSDEARARNRRVDIVIVATQPTHSQE